MQTDRTRGPVAVTFERAADTYGVRVQARIEGVPILSGERALRLYDVDVHWSGGSLRSRQVGDPRCAVRTGGQVPNRASTAERSSEGVKGLLRKGMDGSRR